jgi:phosphate starvation-inducible PhoH-like protein
LAKKKDQSKAQLPELGLESLIPLVPKNEEQKNLIKTIEDNVITLIDGPAGSGKTFVAAVYGLQQLLQGRYKKMLISRPPVDAGPSLGYLPGEFESKLSVYLIPVFDTFSQVISEEQIKQLCKKNGDPSPIKILPLSFMRGVSFINSYVIIDEAQNTTTSQMRMILTRIGENSKLVLTGDSTQSDLRYENGHRDAIIRFTDIAKEHRGIGIVKLTEKSIVRHPIIEIIEEAYRQK